MVGEGLTDIFGIGEWQAARINERSEVLNELNRPFFSSTFATPKGSATVELTPVHVLFFILIYYLYADVAPMLKGWLDGIFSSPMESPDNPTVENVFGTKAALLNPITAAQAARVEVAKKLAPTFTPAEAEAYTRAAQEGNVPAFLSFLSQLGRLPDLGGLVRTLQGEQVVKRKKGDISLTKAP